jgi:hypothetical protein
MNEGISSPLNFRTECLQTARNIEDMMTMLDLRQRGEMGRRISNSLARLTVSMTSNDLALLSFRALGGNLIVKVLGSPRKNALFIAQYVDLIIKIVSCG